MAVWLYEEQCLIVYDDLALAQYTVDYQPDHHRLRDVTKTQLFDTPYRSPQLLLWHPSDDEWRKVYHLPYYVRWRRPRPPEHIIQEVLVLDDTA